MKIRCLILLTTALACFVSCAKHLFAATPWEGRQQQLPGKVECELYDEGGEGVAYHDTDAENNGSGKLNPVDGNPLNEFRIHDGADISYTKAECIDDSPFNKTERSIGQFYLGWTQPTEWVNYSVRVKKTATYRIGALYTANGDGLISIDVNGKDKTGPMKIVSTYDARDTVAWRQWHHWNKLDSIGKIDLKRGDYVLTLHIVGNGNLNLDCLTFLPE